MKELYFLYHVPKTGGQTIRDHLAANLVRDRDFLHLGKWDRERRLGYDDVAALDAAQRRALRSIGGHPLNRSFAGLFEDRLIREVVFVREPASRIVSHYNFRHTLALRRGDVPPSFDEFVSELSPNPIASFLGNTLQIAAGPSLVSNVLAALGDLWMVGTTESMDRLAPTIFTAMGLDGTVPTRTNVSGGSIDRHVVLTPQLAEDLRERCADDVVLYAACRLLEQRTMERLGLVTKRTPRRPLGFSPR